MKIRGHWRAFSFTIGAAMQIHGWPRQLGWRSSKEVETAQPRESCRDIGWLCVKVKEGGCGTKIAKGAII